MSLLNWVRTQWDRAAALAALVIGLGAFLFGWIGVSGSAYVAAQLPYIVSGALLGIFMVGVAAVLWLSADLRDEWRELRGIRQLLKEQNAGHVAARSSDERPTEQTTVIPAVADGFSASAPASGTGY